MHVLSAQADFLLPVPVVRAQDLAKPGTGFITISDQDPCLALGRGTKFTEEFAPRMQILLPKSVRAPSAEVVEVISDDRLRIKKEFANDSGIATEDIQAKLQELRAGGKDGLEIKKVPHVDQAETYAHVYSALNDGGCIAIFPEGKLC